MLIECYYCGERSPQESQNCVKCNTSFSFLTIPAGQLTDEQLHAWLFSEHYQIYEQAQRAGLASLTVAQRLNYLVGYLYFQVENGGVWQYFSNPCGPDAPLLVGALETIGAIETARAIQACLDNFPDGAPPHSAADRSAIIANIPEAQRAQLDDRIVALLLGEQTTDGLPEEGVLRLLKETVDAGV